MDYISEFSRMGSRFPLELENLIKEYSMPRYRKPLRPDLRLQLDNNTLQTGCQEWDQINVFARMKLNVLENMEGWTEIGDQERLFLWRECLMTTGDEFAEEWSKTTGHD